MDFFTGAAEAGSGFGRFLAMLLAVLLFLLAEAEFLFSAIDAICCSILRSLDWYLRLHLSRASLRVLKNVK